MIFKNKIMVAATAMTGMMTAMIGVVLMAIVG
jgi:hypothetical protein